MEIVFTSPDLLFSAISLFLLAYTNRFLSYAQLVRTLKEQYMENPSSVKAAQIANLRKRLYLPRAMQVAGIGSLLLCVVSMFFDRAFSRILWGSMPYPAALTEITTSLLVWEAESTISPWGSLPAAIRSWAVSSIP